MGKFPDLMDPMDENWRQSSSSASSSSGGTDCVKNLHGLTTTLGPFGNAHFNLENRSSHQNVDKGLHKSASAVFNQNVENIDDPTNHYKSMREKLLDQVLNVESLSIGEFQLNLHPEDHLYLPALKKFSWHNPPTRHSSSDVEKTEIDNRRAALKMMLAAPNLETIENFDFERDHFIVLQAHKIRAVKSLTLSDTVNPYNLLEFMLGHPELKTVRLYQTPSGGGHHDNQHHFLTTEELKKKDDVRYAVEELLFTASDTLETLDLSQFCFSIDIQLPTLTHLSKLTIGGGQVGSTQHRQVTPSPCLPRHVQLDETFPNLETLDCSRLECQENSNYDLYFPPSRMFMGQMTSVKVLEIGDQVNHFWMEKLHNICPHFNKLVIHSSSNSNHGHHSWGGPGNGRGGFGSNLEFMLLKVFRYWRHLESIEIRIHDLPKAVVTAKKFFCLDSVFCGIREQICRQLRDFGPDQVTRLSEEDVQNLQIRPSIAALPYLKNLKIIFDHPCLGKLSNQPPPLTHVSVVYGFHHLHNLNVDIVFDHTCPWGRELEKKFEAVRPYVHLTHKLDRGCRHHQQLPHCLGHIDSD